MWSEVFRNTSLSNCTEPIRLFYISNFPSIVKDELAVLQPGTAVELPAETPAYRQAGALHLNFARASV